jgi:hypothetical protein
MSAAPLRVGTPDPNKDPYFLDHAIPTLIARRYRDRFHKAFPDLNIIEDSWFAFAGYSLRGGFRPWSLLPKRAVTLARGWRENLCELWAPAWPRDPDHDRETSGTASISRDDV